MVSDRRLAELMDMIGQEDKERLAEMLMGMSSDDIAYFKGYVQGYSTAVRHLQAAFEDESN